MSRPLIFTPFLIALSCLAATFVAAPLFAQEPSSPLSQSDLLRIPFPLEPIDPEPELVPQQNFNLHDLPDENRDRYTPAPYKQIMINYTLPHDHPLLNNFYDAWLLQPGLSLSVFPTFQRIDTIITSVSQFLNDNPDSLLIVSPERIRDISPVCVHQLNEQVNGSERTSHAVTATWWNSDITKLFPDSVTVLAVIAEPVGIVHLRDTFDKHAIIKHEGWPWKSWLKEKQLPTMDRYALDGWQIGLDLLGKEPQPGLVTSWLRADAMGLLPLLDHHIEYQDLFLPLFILAPVSLINAIANDNPSRSIHKSGSDLSLFLAQTLDWSIDQVRSRALELNHQIKTNHAQISQPQQHQDLACNNDH